MLTNDSTCSCTYSRTNGSTNSRVTSNLTNDSTQSSTTGSTDSSTLCQVITTCHHDAGAQSDSQYFDTFHNLSY